jgi:hypothetical protein
MTITARFGSAAALLFAGLIGLSACASRIGSSSMPDALPASDPNDRKALAALLKEQEARLAACVREHGCDRAHFASGLIALGESRDAAARHFRDAAALDPKSPYAALSASWLKRLEASSDQKTEQVMAQTAVWLLLDSLSREQALKQALAMRERKLSELSTQLQALKRIDMDLQGKTTRIKPHLDGPNSDSTH